MTQQLAVRILRRILQAWLIVMVVFCVVVEDWVSAVITAVVLAAVVHLLADGRGIDA